MVEEKHMNQSRENRVYVFFSSFTFFGVAPADQTKEGPKRKVHEFRPFLWILVIFLRKTSTIHIELLFRNAPAKSS